MKDGKTDAITVSEGIASPKQDGAHEDVPPNWNYRRFRLVRAAQVGLARIYEVAAEAIEDEAKRRGHVALPFLARHREAASDLGRAVVDALVAMRAVDLISPGLEIEAAKDERDRISAGIRQQRYQEKKKRRRDGTDR